MTDFDCPLHQEISLLSTFDGTRIVVAANVGFDGLRCGGVRKGQKAALGRVATFRRGRRRVVFRCGLIKWRLYLEPDVRYRWSGEAHALYRYVS